MMILIALLVCLATVGILYAAITYVRRRRVRTIGEELVIRVVEEQIAKEKRHADGQLASYDKNQRRLACMQRFERYALDQKIPLPVNLLARINAQCTIMGM